MTCWNCHGELEPDHEFCGWCGSPRTGGPRHFKRVEDEYFKLRGQLDLGRITREAFEASLQAMLIRDQQQRYWMLGLDSGKWYLFNGATWTEANPYAN